MTVARYYRPNGQNIHRGKDASEDDQWGVQPSEGMEVELDEASVEKLAKRRSEDAYPSLALVADSTAVADDDSSEVVGSADAIESILTIDSQLRRAVEHLRKMIASETGETTAA